MAICAFLARLQCLYINEEREREFPDYGESVYGVLGFIINPTSVEHE